MNPSVSIVIVNYNGAEFIGSSIDSALAQKYDGELEVVVLDNCSTDDSLEMLRRIALIRLIENDNNVGFGAGVNRAVSTSGADYVAFLNPDAVADPTWIARIVSWMDECDIDFASSIVTSGQSTFFAGGFYLVSLGTALHFRRTGHFSDWLSGCALVARRTSFCAVDGFDEAFFLYSEDVDLSLRAKAAGYKLAIFPEPLVDHPNFGRSTNQLGVRKSSIVYESRGRLIARHVPPFWQPLALAFACTLSPLCFGVTVNHLLPVASAVIRGFKSGRTLASSSDSAKLRNS